MSNEKPDSLVTILIAEDDEDDRLMALEALRTARVTNDIRFVMDGQDLMDYLRCEGSYTGGTNAPRPSLILLDLNMPRKDGREALQEIKADPAFSDIPIIVLSTSSAEEDILRTYDLGVDAFITKPVSLEGMVDIMTTLGDYWLRIVKLPGTGEP